MPRPRVPCRGEAPVVVNLAALAHVHGDLSQDLFLRLAARPDRPSARPASMRWARSSSRGRAWARQAFPERGAQIADLRVRLQRVRAGGANRAAVEIELRASRVPHCRSDAPPPRPDSGCHSARCSARRRLYDVERDDRSLQAVAPRARCSRSTLRAVLLQQRLSAVSRLASALIAVVGFDQQTARRSRIASRCHSRTKASSSAGWRGSALARGPYRDRDQVERRRSPRSRVCFAPRRRRAASIGRRLAPAGAQTPDHRLGLRAVRVAADLRRARSAVQQPARRSSRWDTPAR